MCVNPFARVPPTLFARVTAMLTTSFSSLQSFAECPRQWYLKDYRRLKPVVEKRTGALGFGGRIHAALEIYFKTGTDLIEVWQALSAHEYGLIEAAGGGFGTEELDKETKLGQIMLEGFLDWEAERGSDQEFEVIDVEKQMKNLLRIATPEGEPVDIWLYGKLDQLLRHRDTGRFRILDWKTTVKLEGATNTTLSRSPQPRIYRSLLAQEFPGLDIDGVRFTALRKVQRSARATPPFYWNFDMMMSPYNVQAHMTRVIAVVGQMQHAVDQLDAGVPHEIAVPFHPGWRCDMCLFKAVCSVMQLDGMQAAEDMIEDQFTDGDPFERYTKDAQEEYEI